MKHLLSIERVGVLVLAAVLALVWSIRILEPEYAAVALPETRKESQAISILAVGDIMLSRNVSAKIVQAGDPGLPFANLKDMIAGADIAFGNLECPLSDSGARVREGSVFRCLISDSAGLWQNGFDVLSTANNHSMDQGVEGLEFTIDYLKSKGILPVGTVPRYCEESNSLSSRGLISESGRGDPEVAASLADSLLAMTGEQTLRNECNERGVIKKHKETNFGFLAYSYSAFNDGGRSTHPQIATMDTEKLKADISELKARGADFIIVSMHAGTEYRRAPNQSEIDFARAAIDAGVDAVIGHHPHWIQPIEIYKNRPIFYSLGNFVFDQMWSRDTREGMVVKLNIKNKKLNSAELMPVIIDNYCCPRLADEREKEAILRKIGLESDTIEF